MAQHTRHDHGAIAPLAEIIVKLVILHILIATDWMLEKDEKEDQGIKEIVLTV